MAGTALNIEAVATQYGPAAIQLLGNQIAEPSGDPLSPVTVVGSSNYLAVTTRRNLAATGGISNVHFTTLSSLAARLGAPALAKAGCLFNPLLRTIGSGCVAKG